MSLITCENLAYAYDGHIAVKDLNFSIEDGDYVCIVGENGAGKSTLIKGILNLKKPISGSYTLSNHIKRNQIGYLPQQSLNQKDFPASVYEVVLSGCLNRLGHLPFYRKKDKQLVQHYLEVLQISHLKHKCFKELSGGQQQRVLLARCLCASDKLIILDEPTAGLDPIMSQELYQIIRKINKELHTTIIMVSHDIKQAVNQADKILHINYQQLFFGTTQEYIESPIGQSFIGGSSHA